MLVVDLDAVSHPVVQEPGQAVGHPLECPRLHRIPTLADPQLGRNRTWLMPLQLFDRIVVAEAERYALLELKDTGRPAFAVERRVGDQSRRHVRNAVERSAEIPDVVVGDELAQIDDAAGRLRYDCTVGGKQPVAGCDVDEAFGRRVEHAEERLAMPQHGPVDGTATIEVRLGIARVFGNFQRFGVDGDRPITLKLAEGAVTLADPLVVLAGRAAAGRRRIFVVDARRRQCGQQKQRQKQRGTGHAGSSA